MADNAISVSREVSADLARAADVLESMQSQSYSSTLGVPLNIPPALFGAGGPMLVQLRTFMVFLTDLSPRLKQFDESAVNSRKGSQAPTPPQSVKGIGGKGASSVTN